jgi:6-phosphogluconolactonase
MRIRSLSALALVTGLLLSSLGCSGPAPAPVAAVDDYLVYVGTYTQEASKGIYAYRYASSTGELTPIGLVAEIEQASFQAVHPNGRFLYSVSETDEGSVVAYAIDRESGKLTELNRVSAHGAWPCHLNVDATGGTLAVANYNSGNLAAFPINPDGSLGEASAVIQHEGKTFDEARQPGPLAHSVNYSPDNRFLMASDKGLDKVFVYKFDPATSSLTPNTPDAVSVNPGSGPRHSAFHPNARYAYGINEIASTLTAYAYDADQGALTELQTLSTLPEGFSDRNSTAEIEVHPSGKFLYGSNRGHNSIALFAIDAEKGTVNLVEHAATEGGPPRNFAIDPTGQFLFAANQRTGNILSFRIDSENGHLTPTGKSVEIDSPVCIKFVAL